jgi:hypothetical protein
VLLLKSNYGQGPQTEKGVKFKEKNKMNVRSTDGKLQEKVKTVVRYGVEEKPTLGIDIIEPKTVVAEGTAHRVDRYTVDVKGGRVRTWYGKTKTPKVSRTGFFAAVDAALQAGFNAYHTGGRTEEQVAEAGVAIDHYNGARAKVRELTGNVVQRLFGGKRTVCKNTSPLEVNQIPTEDLGDRL